MLTESRDQARLEDAKANLKAHRPPLWRSSAIGPLFHSLTTSLRHPETGSTPPAGAVGEVILWPPHFRLGGEWKGPGAGVRALQILQVGIPLLGDRRIGLFPCRWAFSVPCPTSVSALGRPYCSTSAKQFIDCVLHNTFGAVYVNFRT